LTTSSPSETLSSQFFSSLSYTGPSKPISIQPLKSPHAQIYSDSPAAFTDLPANFLGGEYLQLPSADHNYSALDLIQFTAAKTMDLYIAHDDRLPRPGWLTSNFKATSEKITLPDNTPATLYERTMKKDASLTLGGNTDSQFTGPSALYVVIAAPHKK
jgi:beta-galactosidase